MDSLDSLPKSKPPSSTKQPRLIACRECHRYFRSKLRCDREYPCKSCIKRGCADICPNGILIKTKRQKSSAQDSAKLQEANESLNDRVRQLEEALASSHAQFTNDPHPLLTDRLFLSDPQARNRIHEKQLISEAQDDPGTISAYGTLAIGSDGQATFHGIAANADALLESETKGNPSNHHLNRASDTSTLPPEILELGRLFPFGTHSHSSSYIAELKGRLVKYLPLAEKAWSLCDTWYENGAWLNDPIPRAEFLQHVFNPIYKASSPEAITPDQLAVMFIILALGSLLDLRKSFDQATTEPLYQLSCAAFCLTPIYESATIPAIQTLHLIGVYMFMTNRRNLEYRWLTAGLTSRLMESAGLHRNIETWMNDTVETQRRCKVFWESYTWDVWQSFYTGRSPALGAPHIQCKMPLEPVDQSVAEATSAYKTWKYQYRYRCLVPVMEEAFGARSPSHATILRLDRKIRDFEVPPILKMVTAGSGGMSPSQNGEAEDVSPALTFQRYAVCCEREMTLLHLHRSYFSQALHDSPANPLGDKHAASVFATYRSASVIVSATQDVSLKHPELASRTWYIWSNLFPAATVLGNIVIRSPSCQLSSSAMIELGVAAGLLENRTVRSRSSKVVPVIKQLRDKAQEVFKQQSRKAEASAIRRSPSGHDVDLELAPYGAPPHFARSNYSASSSDSPAPDLPTPEMFPSLQPNAFNTVEGGVPDYMNGPSNGCTVGTGEWLRSEAEPYMGAYGAPLSFTGISGNYGPWAGEGSQLDQPQAAAGYLDRGGYHTPGPQGTDPALMQRPQSIRQVSR